MSSPGRSPTRRLRSANTQPLKNVVLSQHIASFVGSGVELNTLINTTTEARDAVLNYSEKTFEKLATMENIERDAEKGDITLALELLSREPITRYIHPNMDAGIQNEFNSSSTVWSKTIKTLYKLGKIFELNDLFSAGISPNVLITDTDERFDRYSMITLLMAICRDGNLRMFNMLMEHKPLINLRGLNRGNALTFSVYGGDLRIIRKLLIAGASLRPDYWSISPIRSAIDEGSLEIFKLLMQYFPVDANRLDTEKQAIIDAFIGQSMHIVDYILEEGFDIRIAQKELLRFSCVHRDLEKFKYFVEKGANRFSINLINSLFDRDLNLGTHRKDIVVELSLELFDYVVGKIQEGITDDQYDFNGKKVSMSKFLGIGFADPDGSNEETLLGVAIDAQPHLVKRLLELGSPRVEVYNGLNDYQTAIHYRSLEAFEAIAKFDFDTQQSISSPIVFECIDKDLYEYIEVLGRYNYDFKVTKREEEYKALKGGGSQTLFKYSSPLVYAVEAHSGQAEVIPALLKAGADPNYIVGNMSPLFAFIARFRDDEAECKVVEVLMEAGANANEEINNSTPLQRALQSKSYNYVNILLDRKWSLKGDMFSIEQNYLEQFVFNSISIPVLFLLHSDYVDRERILGLRNFPIDELIQEARTRKYNSLQTYLTNHKRKTR